MCSGLGTGLTYEARAGTTVLYNTPVYAISKYILATVANQPPETHHPRLGDGARGHAAHILGHPPYRLGRCGRSTRAGGQIVVAERPAIRVDGPLIPAAPADLVGPLDRKLYVPSRKLLVVRMGPTAPETDFDQQLWLRLANQWHSRAPLPTSDLTQPPPLSRTCP
jgi:hypothetical protein